MKPASEADIYESEPSFAELLHRRVADACLSLYRESQYKHAARQAMTEVELALKEKVLASKKYFGRSLIDYAFGKKGDVVLTVPFGESSQEAARALFKSSFIYYRNYAAHDGRLIDKKISARVLILASELLDLLDVTPRCLRIEGGLEGLVDHGHFTSLDDFRRFLELMDGQNYPEELWDGLLETLVTSGFDWDQILLVKDLGLLREHTWVHEDDGSHEDDGPGFGCSFELTEHGRKILATISKPDPPGSS